MEFFFFFGAFGGHFNVPGFLEREREREAVALEARQSSLQRWLGIGGQLVAPPCLPIVPPSQVS
jgi:hypothetical protein